MVYVSKRKGKKRLVLCVSFLSFFFFFPKSSFAGWNPYTAGTYTFNIVPILGNPIFDWFFSLIIIFGVLAFSLGILFNLISRS